ncbi:MAG: hypothetical protein NVSMB55_13030 [Mycobacteriales bacterium]
MATVAQLSDPYGNHLLPVRPAGPGVCEVCGTSVRELHRRCWQCSQHTKLPARADAVGAVALVVKRTQLAFELGGYKSSPHPQARQRLQMGLAAVTWRWLAGHERCLAEAAGAGSRFDVVTTVPSSRGRATHPLRDMVSRQIVPTVARHADLLEPAKPVAAEQHQAQAGMYRTSDRLAGRSVLLVDDTWTTGAHAQSAACALKLAGAGPVGILAIGRHFQPDQAGDHAATARQYLAQAARRGWSWSHCSRC